MITPGERTRNASPANRSPVRLSRVGLLALLPAAAFFWTGCGDRSVGPEQGGGTAHLAMAAVFPESASSQASQVDAWRVQVIRPGEEVIAEESGSIATGQETVSVAITVTLNETCETLVVRVELSREGEIWFLSEEPQEVCVGDQPPVQTQLEWVGPLIGVAPQSLAFVSEEGTDPSAQTFTVTNEGGGALLWTASPGASWLQLSPSSGSLAENQSQTVTVEVTSGNLVPGQYQTSITLSDPSTGMAPLMLPVTFTVTEIPRGAIAGRVLADEEGLPDVQVGYTGRASGTTTTDALGAYQIQDLPVGTYQVSISGLPEGVFFASTAQEVVVTAGETTVADFSGAVIRTSTISGSISVEGEALAEVTVSLTGAQSGSTFTNGSGQFSFTGLRDGTYQVSISGFPSDVTFPATTQVLSLGVGDAQSVTFAGSFVRTSLISGRVSASDVPVSGVLVTLTGGPVGVNLTDQTDDAGRYDFQGLRAGTYTVTISNLPPWASFTTTSHQVTVLAAQSVNSDFRGTLLPVPSPVNSYIEACPAVVLPLNYEDFSNVTVAARDAAGSPISGADVVLSGDGYFESPALTTGVDGNASTIFSSFVLGAKTLTAQITAHGSTITIQESDDLYIDQFRSTFLLKDTAYDGQIVVAGQTATFWVSAFYMTGGPAVNVPVGWELQGGNCFYGFTNGSGRAGANVSIPASTKPGTYYLTAQLAGGSPLTFTFYVVGALSAPAEAAPPGVRMFGSPVDVGGGTSSGPAIESHREQRP